MVKGWGLLRNLAKGLVRNAGRPFGVDVVGNILADAWENWDKDKKLQDKLRELQEYAEARVDVFLQAIRASLDEAAQSERSDNPLDRSAYEAWLAQIPGRIQRAWQRPSDPEGKTAPSGTMLRSAIDLEFIVPPELPKFKAGDRPVGNYELIRPLGNGGFSEVWLAREINLGKQVALKFGLTRAEVRARYGPMSKSDVDPLRHEVAVLKRLEAARVREGILQPIMTYLDREPACLVYEYIPDGDLNGVIHDLHHTNKSPEESRNLGHRVVLTLARYLADGHAAGIVHRDLKPSNILVRRLPLGELTLLIADFGIGGFSMQESIRTSRTTMSQARYQTTMMRSSHTPVYASPQQVAMQDPNPADDVHALGVLWYQLLTGDMLRMVPAVPSNWMSRLRAKGVTQDFIDLIGRCLAPELEDRVVNAGLLAEYCQRTLDVHDVELQKRLRQESAEQAARDVVARRMAADEEREAAEQMRRQAAVTEKNQRNAGRWAKAIGGIILGVVIYTQSDKNLCASLCGVPLFIAIIGCYVVYQLKELE